MPSLAEIQFTSGVANQGAQEATAADKENKYQTAVKQAADLYKQGKPKEAVAAMFAVDPELTKSVLSNGYAPEQGKLQAQQEYGQLPTQIQASKAQSVVGGGFKDINLEGPDGSVIKMKMDKKTGKIFDLNGDPADATTLAGMKAGFAPTVGVNPNTKEHALYSKGGVTKQIGEGGAAIETTPSGEAVALTPKQNDGIIKDVKDWNKDPQVKDLTSAINNGSRAKDAIIANVPGQKMLEQLAIIRTMAHNRPAVQEVLAVNAGAGWETQMDEAAAQAAGQGMSATTQKNMLNILDIMQKHNMADYSQLLHSRAAQTGVNYKIDPTVVVGRMAPEMPTPIQENLKKVSSLPAQEQQIINQAHEYILNHKRTDPDYNDAVKVLKMHGLY